MPYSSLVFGNDMFPATPPALPLPAAALHRADGGGEEIPENMDGRARGLWHHSAARRATAQPLYKPVKPTTSQISGRTWRGVMGDAP